MAQRRTQLAKPGDNTFKVFVFDSNGARSRLGEDKIVIARTAASIDAIPASHLSAWRPATKFGGRLSWTTSFEKAISYPRR